MVSERQAFTIIPSKDPASLRPFYEDVLGLAVTEAGEGYVRFAAGDGSVFAISRSGGAASGTHTQMAFDVPDVRAAVTALLARGVVFESYEQPKTVDFVARMPAGEAAWFKDPEGNILALLERAPA